MQKIQDIVPVTLKSDEHKQRSTSQSISPTSQPKVALQVKRNNTELTIYNGCNNYILNAALEGMISHNH